MAPAGYRPIKKYLYLLLRFSHILLTASVLPLAVWYGLTKEIFHTIPGAIAGVAVFGAILSALLYMALEQFSYPGSLFWALCATVSLLLNAWTGASLGDFNIYYGAYSALMSALVAQFLFLSVAAFLSGLPKTGKKLFGELPSGYTFFLAGLSLTLAALLWAFYKPVQVEFFGETSTVKKGVYLGAFFLDVLFDMKTLKEGSILGNAAAQKTKTTWKLYKSWTPVTVIMIIFSITASLGLLFIVSMNP